MVGSTLQHYKIVRKLGKGGMGEVFLAEDTKLDREVALKVLPEEMAADPERRSRFEREARAVAALNHPNIVTLHSVEESDGVHFLTMELVGGKTLTDTIPNGGLGLSSLLDVAVDLADALAAAHAEGITHRDLKPDNIMFSNDGRLKVLDFGLAKPAGPVLGEGSSTHMATASVTTEGKILGTVAYMSPEQAQGGSVDSRADVFAFGVVLYQAATGGLPFEGDNSVSMISSIMKDEPRAVSDIKPALPAGLSRIVRRCLQKEPSKRYQSTVDLGHDLRELREQFTSGELDAPIAMAPSRRSPVVPALAAVALVAAALAVWGWARSAGSGADSAPRSRTMSRVTDIAGSESFPALSPDGKSVVYVAREGLHDHLMLHRIGGDNPINLTAGADADHDHPSFSPDGERIAFRSERLGGGLFVMGATGESVRRLTDFGFHPSWSPDGRYLVFSTDNIDNPAVRTSGAEAWTVDVETTETTRIAAFDVSQPMWSPDGRRIAYWGLPEGTGRRDIFTMAPDGSDVVAVTADNELDWNPVWSPDGRSLYFLSDRGGTFDVWRAPVEPASGQATGPLEQVTSGAGELANLSAMTSEGRLAFVAKNTRHVLVRLPFDGSTERASGKPQTLLESSEQMTRAGLSIDQRQVLVWSRAKDDRISILSLESRERRTLLRDEFRNRVPVWCGGDRQVLFMSDRRGAYDLWSVGADGRGLAPATDFGHTVLPLCDQAAGRVYLFDTSLDARVQTTSWDGEKIGDLELLFSMPAGKAFAGWDLSPDGSKIGGTTWTGGAEVGAFVADTRTGEYETYDFDTSAPIGLAQGHWLSDSRRLVYAIDGEVRVLDSATGETRLVEGLESEVGSVLDVFEGDRALLVHSSIRNDDIWIVDLTER